MIFFYLFYLFAKTGLALLEIRYVRSALRQKPVMLDQESYESAGEYTLAKERLVLLESMLDLGLFFFWITVGFGWLAGLPLEEGSFKWVLMVDLFIIVNFFVGLPLDIYARFGIDKRFGFTQSGPMLYAVDTLKSGVLFLVFGSLIFWALVMLIDQMAWWWVAGFAVVFGVILVTNMLYPTLIAPMFNTFTPLEDQRLKEKIEALLERVGFESRGVFIMDASKRDSRLNAYFGGLGKSKRVVLFDTLLKKLDDGQLISVLAHELGHFKHKDLYKLLGTMGAIFLAVFWVFGHLPSDLYVQMHLPQNGGTTLLVMLLLMTPVSFLITPVIAAVSRKNEFAADAFSQQMIPGQGLIESLLLLSRENKKFPRSHPLHRLVYETHPGVLERVEALGGMPLKEA